jgi:diguanylate cyclase (GGDEF)-like protein
MGDPSLSAGDFERSDRICSEAGENGVHPGFMALSQARFLRDRDRSDDALRLLEERIDLVESTRYPRLVAEAYALDAELLLAAGRVPQAERQAQRAIEASKDTPTSLPVAMAEKVLFEIHRQRGDSSAALRHLQRHIGANRALAEESLAKERAFRTVQHESLQREQELALATERNRVLDLEARLAKAESRNAVALAVVLLLTVGGLVAWGRRLWTDAKRFREFAQTDPLTGFASRQHFTELAAAAVARARTEAKPLMLVAFDLDHFKRINDRHGHLAGDAVLRAVSEAVRAVTAPVPRTIARIGGEEFAILLEGATETQAATYAEALRRTIASAEAVADGGAPLKVTASFGLTGTHEAGHELQALLDRSDRALYRAKNEGRDRIIATDRAHALEAA